MAKVYFDYAQDAAFGIVNRADFENHLQLHFQSAGSHDGDAASYALRNAVYAVGCRATRTSDESQDFSQIQEKSLQLFFNAFSVFPEMLFMPSGMRAVQALLVMVCLSSASFSFCVLPALLWFWIRLADPNKKKRHHTQSSLEAPLSNTCSAVPPLVLRSPKAYTDSPQHHGGCRNPKFCTANVYFGPFIAMTNTWPCAAAAPR